MLGVSWASLMPSGRQDVYHVSLLSPLDHTKTHFFIEAESMHFYVPLFENSQTVEAKRYDAVVGFSSEAPKGVGVKR